MFPQIPEGLTAAPPNLDGTQKEHHAFIACRSEDEGIAKELKDGLEIMNFKVCSDDDREPGYSLMEFIREAIDKSQKVILLVTKEASNDNWVVFEIASSKAKCIAENEDLLIPIICDADESQMPVFIQEFKCLKASDRDFWQHLIGKLTDKIPLSESLPVGNIAHGIAWSYFYGFLNVVLPDMAEKMDAFHTKNDDGKKCYKFVGIIPDSCKIPSKFQDKGIKACGKLHYDTFRAGKPRSYGVTVYSIEDPDTQERYLIPMLYANAVSILHEMEIGRASRMDRQERLRQVKLFKEKIEEIVNYGSKQIRAVFISYQDDCEKPEDSLTKVVMRHLKGDHTVWEKPSVN